jgi:hypothetical protein
VRHRLRLEGNPDVIRFGGIAVAHGVNGYQLQPMRIYRPRSEFIPGTERAPADPLEGRQSRREREWIARPKARVKTGCNALTRYVGSQRWRARGRMCR